MSLVDLLLNSTWYLEITTVIVALFYYRKFSDSPIRSILYFLIAVVLLETLGRYMRDTITDVDNRWVYNLIGTLEIICYGYLYGSVIKSMGLKRLVWLLTAFCIVVILIDGFCFSSPYFREYLSYAFGFSSLVISIFCILYLVGLARTDRVMHLSKVLMFWISIGSLLYHLCNLPITIVSNILTSISDYADGLLLIQTFSSIIMYVCFIIGFKWSQQKYNT